MGRPYESDLVDVAVVFKRETEKAWCVNAGEKADIWLPKSQCELERGGASKADTLTLPEWLAKEKGLI